MAPGAAVTDTHPAPLQPAPPVAGPYRQAVTPPGAVATGRRSPHPGRSPPAGGHPTRGGRQSTKYKYIVAVDLIIFCNLSGWLIACMLQNIVNSQRRYSNRAKVRLQNIIYFMLIPAYRGRPCASTSAGLRGRRRGAGRHKSPRSCVYKILKKHYKNRPYASPKIFSAPSKPALRKFQIFLAQVHPIMHNRVSDVTFAVPPVFAHCVRNNVVPDVIAEPQMLAR